MTDCYVQDVKRWQSQFHCWKPTQGITSRNGDINANYHKVLHVNHEQDKEQRPTLVGFEVLTMATTHTGM
jgi:hypothetical protein